MPDDSPPRRSTTRRDALKRLGAAGALSALAPSALSAQDDAPSPPADNPPNIVLLFTDDQGYGDLSSFGHPTINTPTLDRVGREGMKLTSLYAGAPGCTPSRAAMLTGRYAGRTGLWNVIFPNQNVGLSGDEVTIPETLPDSYRTQMVGKWHVGHNREEYLPTSQGFDHFFGLPYSNDMQRPWVQRPNLPPIPLLRDGEVVEEPVDQTRLTERYTSEATDFISEATGDDDPFFLYLAYNMPHLPLRAPERFRGQSRAGLYGDVIEMIDWSAGQILDELERQGVADNTLFVFTSDNGPWFNMPPRMLEGGVKRWHAGSPGLLRGAKGTTYEGGLRVPAVVRWPDQIPGGRISAEPVSIIDFLPTFANAAGGAVPDDRPIDGYNLLPFLRGETDQSPRDRFFYYQSHQLEAVRDRTWKLRIEQNPSGKPELYNLDLDPRERHNRAEEFPDKVSSLKGDMRDLADSVDGTQIGF
jgi:arylsulfatase A-like enzyme